MVQHFVRMMFTACFILPLGCAANEQAPLPNGANAEKPPVGVPPFTAEAAREALVVMLRDKPNGLDFYVTPDRVDIINVDLKERSYWAAFGPGSRKDGAGGYEFSYAGTFDFIKDRWVASEPKERVVHYYVR